MIVPAGSGDIALGRRSRENGEGRAAGRIEAAIIHGPWCGGAESVPRGDASPSREVPCSVGRSAGWCGFADGSPKHNLPEPADRVGAGKNAGRDRPVRSSLFFLVPDGPADQVTMK